jgi:hypothetical protein
VVGKAGSFVRLINVEYDAYNRKFKLLDGADAGSLQDGETYSFMSLSNEDVTHEVGHSEIDQGEVVWFPNQAGKFERLP